MAENVAERCVLVKGFADFDVIPDLLATLSDRSPGGSDEALRFDPGRAQVWWDRFLQNWGVDKDHIEPGEFEPDTFWFAQDATGLAVRMKWLSKTEPPSPQALALAGIGRIPWRERTREDDRVVRQALMESIAEHYVTDNGISVVDLLRFGAEQVAGSRPDWSWFAPGLLLVEIWTLIYWAFENSERAVELCDQLTANREAALALLGVKAMGDDDGERISIELMADATAHMYLEQQHLAAGRGLRTTWARSTSMLLTYAGVFEEFLMGPVSYYYLPQGGQGHG